MADNFTQINRFLAISTPLGPDKLLLQSFSGTEAVSQLFTFHLELLSEDHNIDVGDILGKNVTVTLALPEGQRYFNGFISRFRQLSVSKTARFAHYQAEMSPCLWFLTRTTDSRIFQNKKVPDIIETIFKDNGLVDYERSDDGAFEAWEYCVQYRETAYNFVMRLMESEGIYFFFKHEKSRHVLVMANSNSAHPPLEPKKIIYEYAGGSGYARTDSRVNNWLIDHEIRTGRYTVSDYNFKTPSTELRSNVNTIITAGNPQLETYEYPGGFETREEAEKYARLRMEAEEAKHATVYGESNCRYFNSGFNFDLTEHERRDQNQNYVLTSVTHEASVGGNFSDVTSAEDEHYHNSFTCIPFSVPFRPGLHTPKTVVQGSQTAVVVGPSGEEIYTDKYGRVKVQFHWDRHGKMDENSSCWVRVSHPWAGKGWGGISNPRIGQEVIVDFLEGDPDQPIITGRVYNGDQMPVYTLPDNQTISTMKSNSSKGGGGFNEFRFEDKKGSEQIFIHGERNQDTRIKNDAFEWIGNDRHLIVTKDQYEKVGGDKHLEVKGDRNEKVAGTLSLTTGQDLQEKVGMNFAVDAGQTIHLKAGMNLVIEAGMSITLKAGAGFIVIGPAGVTIVGTPTMINSGGSAGSGAGCATQSPQPPKEADNSKPGEVGNAPPPKTPPTPKPVGGKTPGLDLKPAVAPSSSPQAETLKQAAKDGTPFCEKCEAARLAREQQNS